MVKPASRKFSALFDSSVAPEANGAVSSSSSTTTLTRETESKTAQMESETTTTVQPAAPSQKKFRLKETKGKDDKNDGGVFAPAVLLT